MHHLHKQFLRPGLILLLILGFFTANAQNSTIKGKISSEKGSPAAFVIVFVKGSTDGGLSDSAGNYTIQTDLKGKQTIKVKASGYDTAFATIILEPGKTVVQNFKLKLASRGTEVEISAGSFDATNDRKVAVLRPMDIYTTAGAGGDIVGAIQTLPGTQKVSDQTGLFVRGGDASESATIVDGMVTQNAFFSNVPGVAQRSRFAPFQFKGVSFSSGGYSARYGQAMSGILDLNTNDLAEKTTINLGANLSGLLGSASKLWKKQSLEGTFSYTNLQPFYGITKTNINFFDPPKGLGGSGRYVLTNNNDDILKVFVNYAEYKSGTDVLNPYQPDSTLQFKLQNKYIISTAYYRHNITKKTYLSLASSYSSNYDKVSWGGLPFDKKDSRLQGRAELTSQLASNIFGYVGTEVQTYTVNKTYDSIKSKYDETMIAGYAEAEWKPARWFGIKPGIRFEHSQLLNKENISPRLAAAFKIRKYGQIATAGGIFYQNADDKYLLTGARPDFQKAVHYIANYQYTNEDRTIRVEFYYKSYTQLIKELGNKFFDPNMYRYISQKMDNSGNGYAKGLDVFWRDKKSIKNFDYWISYSLIDSKRNYENFPTSATPTFISRNNLSIVTKYSIGNTGFNVSATYSYASGKPYYNPMSNTFMGDIAPEYKNLALGMNYITSIKKFFGVFYIAADNVTNHKNIMGYRYSYPGMEKYAIVPALYRSVFFGVFISLTPFNKDEL